MRGSLGSGKNSESSCSFPWKHCGEKKEKECGKNIDFLGATQQSWRLEMQMYVCAGNLHHSNITQLAFILLKTTHKNQ